MHPVLFDTFFPNSVRDWNHRLISITLAPLHRVLPSPIRKQPSQSAASPCCSMTPTSTVHCFNRTLLLTPTSTVHCFNQRNSERDVADNVQQVLNCFCHWLGLDRNHQMADVGLRKQGHSNFTILPTLTPTPYTVQTKRKQERSSNVFLSFAPE